MIQCGDPDEAVLPIRLQLTICVVMIRDGVNKRVLKGAQEGRREVLDGRRQTPIKTSMVNRIVHFFHPRFHSFFRRCVQHAPEHSGDTTEPQTRTPEVRADEVLKIRI